MMAFKRSLNSVGLFVLAIGILFLCSCSDPVRDFANAKSVEVGCFDKGQQFPYRADEARSSIIMHNWMKIQNGMTGRQVIETLGDPDCASSAIFPSGNVDGWYWDYSVKRRYFPSVQDDDVNLSIHLSKNGIVERIFPTNLH